MTPSRWRDFAPGVKLPSTWTDGMEALVTNFVSPNFRLVKQTATVVRIPAAGGDDAVSVAIDGKPRWIETNLDIAHPGGAAGVYPLFVTGAVDAFSTIVVGQPNAGAEQDDTDHAFYGRITAVGGVPTGAGTQAVWRQVAQVVWDGTKITAVVPLVGGIVDVLSSTSLSGLYADRPAAAVALNGVRFFATDKAMEWQCVAGVWVLIHVVPRWVTALPTPAIDGEEIYYAPNVNVLPGGDFKGIVWHFRYRAGSTSAYKWEFVGGPPQCDNVDADEALVVRGGHLPFSASTVVAIPLSGEYRVRFGARVDASAAPSFNAYIGLFVDGVPLGDTKSISWTFRSPTGAHDVTPSSHSLPVTVNLGAFATYATLDLTNRLDGGAAVAGRRWIEALPVRVG